MAQSSLATICAQKYVHNNLENTDILENGYCLKIQINPYVLHYIKKNDDMDENTKYMLMSFLFHSVRKHGMIVTSNSFTSTYIKFRDINNNIYNVKISTKGNQLKVPISCSSIDISMITDQHPHYYYYKERIFYKVGYKIDKKNGDNEIFVILFSTNREEMIRYGQMINKEMTMY